MNALSSLENIPFFGQLVQASSNGQAIRRFIKRFDLVYFGKVDHRYDDHAVVRGVTASTQHADRHFAVGNIKGRDVSILERTNTVHFPQKGEQQYTWVIVQVDLKQRHDIPHIFMDAHHHDEIFYANLFVNFANFHSGQSLFTHHDPLFSQRFKVYAPSDKFDDVAKVMTPKITSMMAHHFSKFDYELQSDTIYIYSSNQSVNEHDIERMARIGLWLAEELESSFSVPA